MEGVVSQGLPRGQDQSRPTPSASLTKPGPGPCGLPAGWSGFQRTLWVLTCTPLPPPREAAPPTAQPWPPLPSPGPCISWLAGWQLPRRSEPCLKCVTPRAPDNPTPARFTEETGALEAGPAWAPRAQSEGCFELGSGRGAVRRPKAGRTRWPTWAGRGSRAGGPTDLCRQVAAQRRPHRAQALGSHLPTPCLARAGPEPRPEPGGSKSTPEGSALLWCPGNLEGRESRCSGTHRGLGQGAAPSPGLLGTCTPGRVAGDQRQGGVYGEVPPPGARGLCSQAGGPRPRQVWGEHSTTPLQGELLLPPPAQHLAPAGISQVNHGPGERSQAPPRKGVTRGSHFTGRTCPQHSSSLPWAATRAQERHLKERGVCCRPLTVPSPPWPGTG